MMPAHYDGCASGAGKAREVAVQPVQLETMAKGRLLPETAAMFVVIVDRMVVATDVPEGREIGLCHRARRIAEDFAGLEVLERRQRYDAVVCGLEIGMISRCGASIFHPIGRARAAPVKPLIVVSETLRTFALAFFDLGLDLCQASHGRALQRIQKAKRGSTTLGVIGASPMRRIRGAFRPLGDICRQGRGNSVPRSTQPEVGLVRHQHGNDGDPKKCT